MANKEKQFCRKHPMPGVYGILWKGKHIEIKNRQIFSTADEKLIKKWEEDPEIMEFNPEPAEKEVLDYEDMSESELLNLAKSRGLEKDDVETKDTLKCDLIKELEEYDELNSKSENDQGEQVPERPEYQKQ